MSLVARLSMMGVVATSKQPETILCSLCGNRRGLLANTGVLWCRHCDQVCVLTVCKPCRRSV